MSYRLTLLKMNVITQSNTIAFPFPPSLPPLFSPFESSDPIVTYSTTKVNKGYKGKTLPSPSPLSLHPFPLCVFISVAKEINTIDSDSPPPFSLFSLLHSYRLKNNLCSAQVDSGRKTTPFFSPPPFLPPFFPLV